MRKRKPKQNYETQKIIYFELQIDEIKSNFLLFIQKIISKITQKNNHLNVKNKRKILRKQ